jgi:hypothetical protein
MGRIVVEKAEAGGTAEMGVVLGTGRRIAGEWGPGAKTAASRATARIVFTDS